MSWSAVAIDAIDDAVLTTLQADGTLAGLAPGGVHLDFVPEGTIEIGRFVVMQLVSEVYEFEHGGVACAVARYRLDAVDRATTKTAAQAALDQVNTVMLGSLTIAGHTHMRSKRVERRATIEVDGPDIWQHRIAEYEVWADPS